MRISTIAALSAVALTLAACGSSSDSLSDIDLPTTSEDVPTRSDLPTKYDNLEGLVEAADNGSLAEASEAMMSGTASMSGALEISEVDDAGTLNALGDLSLLADFNGGTVAGSVANVALYSATTQELDSELAGSLAVAGTISGTGLTADANGTLTDDEDHLVTMKMDGTFYDYDGNLAVYGDVGGTVDGEAVGGGFGAIKD